MRHTTRGMRNLLLPILLVTAQTAPAIVPVQVVQVPGYTEGVVFDAEGHAYISLPYQGAIYRVSGSTATIWARTSAPNGHKILADGTHLVCDGAQHAVLHLDRDGKLLGQASSESNGRPLRAPNDLTLDSHGGFYFTDPGGSSAAHPIGTVHYVDRDRRTHLVAEGLAFPNGIVLRPDGRTLLVAESQRNRILSYTVSSSGKVEGMTVFATLPEKTGDQIANEPDGMCLDADGNLYVAHYGMRQVQVFGPEGRLRHRYPAGNLTPSNVAFGGRRMDQLFVTGALGEEKTSPGALFRLDLAGARGLSTIPARP
jgi:gluconolactonase